MKQPPNRPRSSLLQTGLEAGIQIVLDRITSLYKADEIPWVVGYSGGKDSTAVLQLVWTALQSMPAADRKKPVYVISTDTLVENPVVAAWVNKSLQRLGAAAESSGLPIHANRLTPKVEDTYWVNLIGRGYPAPRPKFRWCTMRLKIQPANDFIHNVIKRHGEAIVVLGTRKAESAARAGVMSRLEEQATREKLRPHSMLQNSFVFSPIEDWTNDDVWMFLTKKVNPWGHNNKDLLTMYQGASPDGECPLVIDSSTPSCGDSRFGCWVCTLVEQDKSMTAMVQNDQEREWMLPLLKLRDELIPRDKDGFPADRPLRDFRRMHGGVQLMGDKPIPGPYTQRVRENWLRRVLQAQSQIRRSGPEDMKDLELITLEELKEIRRIWVKEKHEMEDSLPEIFEEMTGVPFPDDEFVGAAALGRDQIALLREICGEDELHFQLTRELLSVERQHRNSMRRKGLYADLDSAFQRNFFDNEEDATNRARSLRDRISAQRASAIPDGYVREIENDRIGSGDADEDSTTEVLP